MTPEPAADIRPIVGIHQPNFFPWLGFFHKLRWSDTFVFLDDVQLQRKNAGTVTNRTALGREGKQVWMTASIDRSASTPRIDEVVFAPQEDFRPRFVSLLQHAYAKAPFMKELGGTILALVQNPEPSLARYNMSAIREIATLLALPAKIVTSSTLGITQTSTERLVAIVRAVGGKTYLAGSGAKGYQEDDLFLQAGIHVLEQRFQPVPYPRGREPELTGLSVIDSLLWTGVAETRKLLDRALDESHLKRARVA